MAKTKEGVSLPPAPLVDDSSPKRPRRPNGVRPICRRVVNGKTYYNHTHKDTEVYDPARSTGLIDYCKCNVCDQHWKVHVSKRNDPQEYVLGDEEGT